MSADFQYDVFLSRNQADKPRVRRLAERRRAAGLERCTVGRGNLPFRDPANSRRRFIPLLRADSL